MRTVITHFYNEEYMLPWWISHHRNMFDYGILIDYSSTDNSADICRSLAPNWRLVRSRNMEFAALAVDFEVMQYEDGLPGWKMVLNVSEFLLCGNLDRLEREIIDAKRLGSWIPAAVMVDPFPDIAPSHSEPLTKQKRHGFLSIDHDFNRYTSKRDRLYHRSSTGAYLLGRHGSQLPELTMAEQPALIYWYGYSPWRPEFLNRKLQIGTQVPKSDREAGWGFQHLRSAAELEQWRQEMLPCSVDLSDRIVAIEQPIEIKGRNIARDGQATQSSVYGASIPTANQAINGVKTGMYGFHTNYELNPWWLLDLGRLTVFDEIIVYNRLNVPCRWRSNRLQVLLSDDNEDWRLVYSHDGTAFGGIDGRPLRVTCSRAHARFVKLRLPGEGILHLDEIEIYDHQQTAQPDFTHSDLRLESELSLAEIARKHSAFKDSRCIANYDRLLRPLRAKPVVLLELGILNGGSLKTWQEYFSSGLICGVDLHLPPLDSADRIRMFQGDQGDPALLTRVGTEVAPDGFDIIIDDGAHIGSLAKLSFWHLLNNHLKPGGLYIVEDWGTGYWPTWPDGRGVIVESDAEYRMPSHDAGMVGFIKQLIDEVGADDIKDSVSHPSVRRSKFASMCVYAGMCVIRKTSTTA